MAQSAETRPVGGVGRIADCGLPDCRIVDCGLPIANCELRGSELIERLVPATKKPLSPAKPADRFTSGPKSVWLRYVNSPADRQQAPRREMVCHHPMGDCFKRGPRRFSGDFRGVGKP